MEFQASVQRPSGHAGRRGVFCASGLRNAWEQGCPSAICRDTTFCSSAGSRVAFWTSPLCHLAQGLEGRAVSGAARHREGGHAVATTRFLQLFFARNEGGDEELIVGIDGQSWWAGGANEMPASRFVLGAGLVILMLGTKGHRVLSLEIEMTSFRHEEGDIGTGRTDFPHDSFYFHSLRC